MVLSQKALIPANINEFTVICPATVPSCDHDQRDKRFHPHPPPQAICLGFRLNNTTFALHFTAFAHRSLILTMVGLPLNRL